MPFMFDVGADAGILHIDVVGEVNDAQLMDLWDRLGHETAFLTGWPILCDCSTATSVMISSNVIVSIARTASSRHNPVAIIAPRAISFGLARMYQIVSDPDSQRIQVFTKAQEARAWLKAGIQEAALHA